MTAVVYLAFWSTVTGIVATIGVLILLELRRLRIARSLLHTSDGRKA
jgi:hypothetical protein